MSCLLKCFQKREDNVTIYREPLLNKDGTNSPVAPSERRHTTEEERKFADITPVTMDDEIDLRSLNFVKNKVKKILPSYISHEQVCIMSKRCLSPTKMSYYFAHLVSGTATNAVLETADEMVSSFNDVWEKAMLQKRSLQRFEKVVNFPVKLILTDLQNALPTLVSSFTKMIQLEFGPLHAALIIDDVIIEWNDTSLIIPSVKQKEWVFQVRLQGSYEKFARSIKQEMKDSAHRMDLNRQIEQVFEVTKEKQQAINQLIEVIVHYNRHYEYNVLTRNCQHFVIDAMKALGINEIPQLTGVFQKYFKELIRGKSTNIQEKFETHAALDEHVNSIIKPGLSQHDLEYLLCQYFMFHVSSRKMSPRAQDPNWKCEEETCRMSEIECMLERDFGSLLFTTFSLNSS